MALSQKHPALMMVPWFNSNEWKSVKFCVTSNDDMKMQQGLNVLNIWKHRTTKLPSGVEGTFLLLTALLEDSKITSSSARFQCYCHALLRFLNICCAQGEKQGTFYRSAKKNNIPDWIIDYRHALAHGQDLPGESEIFDALVNCLDWVKEEYWNKQNETLGDYIKQDHNRVLIVADTYCNITMDSLLYEEAITIKELTLVDNVLKEKIQKLSDFWLIDVHGDLNAANDYLLHLFKASIDNTDISIIEVVSKMVVKYLCSEVYDIITAVNIPRELETKWKNVFILFYEQKILSYLIWELIQFCSPSNFYEQSNESIKLASLWLKYIFKEVLDNEKILENLQNESLHTICGTFELAALSNINKFTSLYLPSLLKLCGYSEFDIHNKMIEIEQKNQNEVISDSSYKAFRTSEIATDLITLDLIEDRKDTNLITIDLAEDRQKIDKNLITVDLPEYRKDCALPRGAHNHDNIKEHEDTGSSLSSGQSIICKNEEVIFPDRRKKRWALVTDKNMFANCPLGVLPTESRTYSHLVNFDNI